MTNSNVTFQVAVKLAGRNGCWEKGTSAKRVAAKRRRESNAVAGWQSAAPTV